MILWDEQAFLPSLFKKGDYLAIEKPHIPHPQDAKYSPHIEHGFFTIIYVLNIEPVKVNIHFTGKQTVVTNMLLECCSCIACMLPLCCPACCLYVALVLPARCLHVALHITLLHSLAFTSYSCLNRNWWVHHLWAEDSIKRCHQHQCIHNMKFPGQKKDSEITSTSRSVCSLKIFNPICWTYVCMDASLHSLQTSVFCKISE